MSFPKGIPNESSGGGVSFIPEPLSPSTLRPEVKRVNSITGLKSNSQTNVYVAGHGSVNSITPSVYPSPIASRSRTADLNNLSSSPSSSFTTTSSSSSFGFSPSSPGSSTHHISNHNNHSHHSLSNNSNSDHSESSESERSSHSESSNTVSHSASLPSLPSGSSSSSSLSSSSSSSSILATRLRTSTTSLSGERRGSFGSGNSPPVPKIGLSNNSSSSSLASPFSNSSSSLATPRLPTTCDPPPHMAEIFKSQIDFGAADVEVGGQPIPVAFAISILEIELRRALKKPRDLFVRCDFGRQTYRTEAALKCTNKAIWSEFQMKFHLSDVSSNTQLVCSLQANEEGSEKVKTFGKVSFPLSKLALSSAGAHPMVQSKSSSKPIGDLYVVIQPFASSFLISSDVALPVTDDLLILHKAPSSSESFSYFSFVKHAELPRIVEILTHENFEDPIFRLCFFHFFSDFTNFDQLLEVLRLRFESIDVGSSHIRHDRRSKIISFLENWLREYYTVFYFIPNYVEALDALRSFIRTTVSPAFERESRQLILLCKHIQQMATDKRNEGIAGSLEINGRFEWSPGPAEPEIALTTFSFLQIDPEVFAEQLTYIESQIFRRVRPLEFARWHYDDHQTNSPALDYLTRHFNNISLWMQTEISFQTRLQERSEILKKAMNICIILAKLNNYNGLMEMLSSINSSAVRRMNRTFQCIDKQLLGRFNKTAAIMSHEGNYRNYRKILAALPKGTPVVPYVGVFLTDLRFMMDGTPSIIKDEHFGFTVELINWQKYSKATEVITMLNKLQNDSNYTTITPNPQFQDWLLSRKFATTEECYQMSRRVDPADYEKLVEEFMVLERKLKDRITELEQALNATNVSYAPMGFEENTWKETEEQQSQDYFDYEDASTSDRSQGSEKSEDKALPASTSSPALSSPLSTPTSSPKVLTSATTSPSGESAGLARGIRPRSTLGENYVVEASNSVELSNYDPSTPPPIKPRKGSSIRPSPALSDSSTPPATTSGSTITDSPSPPTSTSTSPSPSGVPPPTPSLPPPTSPSVFPSVVPPPTPSLPPPTSPSPAVRSSTPSLPPSPSVSPTPSPSPTSTPIVSPSPVTSSTLTTPPPTVPSPSSPKTPPYSSLSNSTKNPSTSSITPPPSSSSIFSPLRRQGTAPSTITRQTASPPPARAPLFPLGKDKGKEAGSSGWSFIPDAAPSTPNKFT